MSITAFNLRCLRSVPPRIGLKQILMESPTRQVGCRFAAHIPEAVVVRGFKTRRHEQIDSVVVNIFGRNRVGLVKDFADVIFINGGNIEESRMDRVGDYFSMLTMVTLPRSDKAAEALQSDLDVKFNEDTLIEPKDNLKISAQPSGRWDRPESLDLAMVTVTGNEQKGATTTKTPQLRMICVSNHSHASAFMQTFSCKM